MLSQIIKLMFVCSPVSIIIPKYPGYPVDLPIRRTNGSFFTSVPKTLIRHVVRHYADIERQKGDDALADAIYDIIDTPVSPELLPADKDGKIAQKTEDLVGPYELHDFYIYNFVKYGFTPRKIFRLAKIAFDGRYDDQTLLKWLEVFTKRFFSQQFKRSCMPDGPKVGSVSLSSADWRMPSDPRRWFPPWPRAWPNSRWSLR